MGKIYHYNPSTFQELMDKYRIRQVDLQNLFKYANVITIRKWQTGAPMTVDKVCKICNKFGISINEFFSEEECDEQITALEMLSGESSENENLEEEMNPETKIGEMEYVLEQVEKARVRERDYQEMIREQERLNYEKQVNKMIERHETFQDRKNNTILDLQRKYNEILLQKKELEMKLKDLTKKYNELEISTFKGASNVNGIAEGKGYNASSYK